MNFSFAQDLSIYQLALEVLAPAQPLPHSPATLLSLLRSQIDLLIEQQITATLWVKLPPGKMWHSEIQRYSQQVRTSGVIRTLHIEEIRSKADGELGVSTEWALERIRKWEDSESNLSLYRNISSENLNDIRVYSQPDSRLQREYFLMVLSPKFCCLILAHRPLRRRRNNSVKANRIKKPLLFAITTFDSKAIQQVLDVVKQAITPKSSLFVPTDFICPSAHEPALIGQLLAKQLRRHDEISRHITIKRLARMQEQNQKLHHTLELKDEYLSNVCQELRTPLTHMKTALSLLNSPNLKPPQRQRYFQMLNTQCDRQNALITGVLDLVQLEHNLERMPLEHVRLFEVVPGVVSIYQPLAREKGIMLAYTVPTELPPVWCVSGGLRQIVINLLSNSIKFTPNGGQVWVRGRALGNYVQLEFRDSGIGIADSEIPKIFDRFYRVRPVVTEDPGGVGLGLSIVQLLLSRCDGSISVKSKLYEGSIFTVQLAIA
ncbi:ATPase [Nostocales cyanobacterium HT-58-2]|nr:ATPase [Nostocales cyanobacterium HT-58-2]